MSSKVSGSFGGTTITECIFCAVGCISGVGCDL